MRLFKFLSLTFMGLILCGCVHKPCGSEIKGVLLDANNGRPIGGAKIYLGLPTEKGRQCLAGEGYVLDFIGNTAKEKELFRDLRIIEGNQNGGYFI
ncbi:MAG: hypothetical protein N3A38_14220, partial [Planctomycetota bacterium]|nr:hypothetical protein [Planctomycetota bacterium]